MPVFSGSGTAVFIIRKNSYLAFVYMKTLSHHINSNDGHSEQELLALLKTGDKAAFTEIYNRFHAQVYRYILALTKSEQTAEDLTHEVFMKLWEIRATLVIRSSFSSWLFRVSHNKAIDALRKIAGDRNLLSNLIYQYGEQSIGPGRSQEELLYYDNLIDKALDGLPPQRRKVYDLCKRNGKTYQEAATELGIAPGTVKEHMALALASLRGFMNTL